MAINRKRPIDPVPFFLAAIAFVAIAAVQPLRAQDVAPESTTPLLLTDEQEAYQLGPHVAILADPEKRWTIEDVASPEFAPRFVPSEAEELQIGFADSAYWVRIQLDNRSQRSEWWLEHADAAMSYLDLYTPLPDGSGFERTQTGLLRPFAAGDISSLTYVLPVVLPSQTTQTLYIRYEHSRSTGLPLYLWSPAAFARQNQLNMWQTAALFTINLLLFSGLFLLWLRMRSQRIFYFALAMCSILAITALERGVGRQYLWPNRNLGIWYLHLNNVGAVILFLSALKFATLFLDTRQRYPKLHRALQALIILMLLVMLQIPFVAEYIINLQITVLYLLAFPLLVVLAVWALLRTYRQTWSQFVTSLLFVSFIVFGILGVLARNGFLSHLQSEQLGFFWNLAFISLLAMFVANVIYTSMQKQQEAQRLQEASSLALEKTNEELEQRVLDRTRELSALYDVTSIASQALDLKATMTQCLDRVVEVMQGNIGAIHLVDETGQVLRLATTRGLPSNTMTELDMLPAGKGLTGQVLEQGEIVIVSDVADDPRTLSVANLNELQSYAGIPIRASGTILGVLGIVRKRGEPVFSVEEVALLGSIADQVGVVVESAMLREQAEQAAVVEERTRLARDLHDSVTQLMYSINLFAAVGQRAYRLGDLDRMHLSLTDLTETTQQAFKEMRLLVYELRPPALEHDDLIGALRHRLETVEQRANIETDFQVGNQFAVPDIEEKAFYYVAEEALNNTLKHAAATEVTVRLDAGLDQIELEIADNGRGFELDGAKDGGGLGLVSMRERIEKLGGKLTVQSAPGAGTMVKATLNRGDSNGQRSADTHTDSR